MNIKRLEQITIEDDYSRHQQRLIILKDITTSLSELFEESIQYLIEYFNTIYSYNSKNERIQYYLENTTLTTPELITEILLVTLPLKVPKSIQSVVGKLAEEMGYNDIFSGIKTAAEVVVVVGKSKLYNIISARNSETGSIQIQSNYVLEDISIKRLNNMKYLPPMICKPDAVWANNHNGYLTKDESILLGKGNHHNYKLNLATVNQASAVKLSLDLRMLQLEEKAKKPNENDSPSQLKDKAMSHALMVKTSKNVYEELINRGNKFYFTWKFDKHGRIYSQGYHVNIQASSYKKSLINLATPQIILGK